VSTSIGRVERPPQHGLRSTSAARVAVTALIVVLAFVTLASGYLSSWLPLVAGFPAGAILRDAICGLLVAAAIVALVIRRSDGLPDAAPARVVVVPLILLCAWTLVLTVTSDSRIGAVLSARNLLLYPLVAVAVYLLGTRGLVAWRVVAGGVLVLGSIAAVLGLADTLTAGAVVDGLGFRRDFAGLPSGEGAIIAGVSGAVGGVVRASGGISDALVFGYLMAFVALFALWLATQVRGAGRSSRLTAACGFAATLAIAAMIASLTRGAWLALAVGLVVLIAMRPSRILLATSVLVIALAIAGTSAMSLVMANADGSVGGQPGATFGGAIVDRVVSSDPASQISSQARTDQFRIGLSTLVAHPLGTGLASEGAGADRAGSVAQKLTPDIYLMIVALQTGLPGIVLWLSAIALILIWAVRHRRNRGAPLIVAAIAFLAVASILSHTPDAPPLSIVFWLIILAIAAALADERADEPASS
jgi:hypothetical protein